MAAHMVIAAYVVGGFLDRVGLRGRHAAGPPRPLPPPRLPHPVHASAAIAIPIQMGVGDSLARWVFNNQPEKFAAIELVPEDRERRARDALRPPQRRRHGRAAASRSPAWRRGCRTRATGTSTVVQGLDTVPGRRAADAPRGQHRPPGVGRDGRARHAAVPAVGLVRRCAGCSAATCPKSSWFLRARVGAGRRRR